jgi:GWxTD domain-containing protein
MQMNRLAFVLIFFPLISAAQALKDINFNYLYNPNETLRLSMQPIRGEHHWSIYFRLHGQDTTANFSDTSIAWEVRSSTGDPKGIPVPSDSVTITQKVTAEVNGIVTVPISSLPQYLVGKVTTSARKLYHFYTLLDPSYPQRQIILSNNKPVLEGYALTNSTIVIGANGRYIVSYYDDNFPTAPPAFSESMGKVSRTMVVDSTLLINGNEPLTFQRPGLYLIQQDTLAPEGIHLRIEDNYPRYSKLTTIDDPLVYLCTSQEFARIKQANGDKKAFDRVILSITKDSERAKTMMRSYFKRVEVANELFTSYKEGWKTDRGMMFIIFGTPDEVNVSADRETWSYKRSEYKASFEFVRSASIYDPNNFVLVRNRRYSEVWYEVVDLWRNARF